MAAIMRNYHEFIIYWIKYLVVKTWARARAV